MKKAFYLLIFIFVFTSQCFSFVPQPTPTIGGSTGVIRMPSADVLPYKNFNTGIDCGPVAFIDKWTLLYKLNLGVFQNMELGAMGTDDQQGGLKEGVFINMKYSLSADTSPYPLMLAMGVENLTSKTLSDVYMVATKYIPNGSRFHFGFIGDFVTIDNNTNRFRPLGALGYDSPMYGERVYGLIDMFAGDKVFQLDLGVRWYVSETFAVNLSALNVFSEKSTPTDNYRDPKSVLIGFSWINPL
jgi:hypothetical protein